MNRYPAPVRRGLADQLVEHLVAAILRGDHPPDSRLPRGGRMQEPSARDAADGFPQADLESQQTDRAAAGNPFIPALFEPLVDLLFEVRRAASGDRPGRETAIAAHRQVLAAIEAGVPQ